jgi:acetyl esterase/lipase
MDPDTELLYDFPPFLRQYKSGRVERIIPVAFVPASHDPSTGTPPETVINPDVGLYARLFMSDISNHQPDDRKKLPVLMLIHCGGFVIHSAFSRLYHSFVSSLVSKSRVLAVSVDHCLAPEHLLPAAYDNSCAALKWVLSNCKSGPDPWLSQHGGSSRVFMAGDSTGANIAHNAVLRAGKEEININGLVLMHPCFLGKDPVGSETTEPEIRKEAEKRWYYLCAGAFGIDHTCVNPMGPRQEYEMLGCKRVLVTVAEKDYLREMSIFSDYLSLNLVPSFK